MPRSMSHSPGRWWIFRVARTPTCHWVSGGNRLAVCPARTCRTCCARSLRQRDSHSTSRSSKETTTTIARRRRSRPLPSPSGRPSRSHRSTTCHPPRGRWGSRVSELVIVDSRVANLASIAGAFRRLHATITVTADADVVRTAARLVLPGVGAFGAGMAALRARGLDIAIRDVAARGTPLLGVCLGMQMLCDASEEAPGVTGLGIIAGTCRRLPANVRIPHLGWNRVTPEPEARLLSPGVAAFANSYALREGPAGWTTAWTTHGVPFIAALERGPTIACQFHPELSGAYGAALLERWLTGKIARAPRAAPGTDGSSGLLRRIIPCLDVKDGRVVKGIRFQDLRDAGDPAEQAARYEAQGADEIVILDVAASAEGRETQVETGRRGRAAGRVPLTLGGGGGSGGEAGAALAAGAAQGG